MEPATSEEARYAALRYETLMAVIAGSLTTHEAAGRLDTSEANVRQWAEVLAARSAAKRRREMLERQAERRSTVAVAIAIAMASGLAFWGAQSTLEETRPASVQSADSLR